MKKSKFSRHCFILILLPIVFNWGCSAQLKNRMMIDSMRPMMDAGLSAYNKCEDLELVKAAMPASLLQIEALIELEPNDKDLLARAANTYNGYAFLFLQDTDKDRALIFIRKANEYGLRALSQNTQFKNAWPGTVANLNTALETFKKEDVSAMMVTTSSYLSLLVLDSGQSQKLIQALPKYEAMMDRILLLDDTFNYGAIYALLGSYYARPAMFGGNLVESKNYFNEALEISESKYLLWHVLYAKYYAVQAQDRELFVKLLQNVIDAKADLLPEMQMLNVYSKERATTLLAHIDDYF